MRNPPRISVIINVYNGESYLEETLRSALAQSCRDFEIIVWDDASTDGSAEVVNRLRDPRIRYFAAPRRVSLGVARSDALQLARGEWVAFLDQDDLWHPDKLRLQIDLADSGGKLVGLVYGRTLAFNGKGRLWDADHRHEFTALPEGNIYLALFRDSCFIAMSSAMLRADAINPLLPIPAEVETIPDYYLFCGVARRFQARAVQRVICHYRVHPGSMTHTVLGKVQEEAVWLVGRHAAHLDAALIRDRYRRHISVAALDQMRTPGHFLRGLIRLIREGSLPFVFSRPPIWLARAIWRRIAVPYWKRMDGK